MGMECPKGHGRQNIVVNITADGSNPVHACEIVAYKLACGCVVGGEKYEEFKVAVAKIDADRAKAIRAIEEDVRQHKAAVYQSFVVREGDGVNAE